MKKTLLLILLLPVLTLAQEDAWVFLTDKPNVEEALANPITILTQKAIDRKKRHNVEIDVRDVPVNEDYITQLKSQTGITVLAKSKWLNTVHIRGTQANIEALKSLSFVKTIEFANDNLNSKSNRKQKQRHIDKFAIEKKSMVDYNYGNAANQIEMINGHKLHELDYTGEGMTIAVIDAGFENVNAMGAFSRLFANNDVLGTYDFVGRDVDVYTNTTSDHGTQVLSTMAGFIENEYVGTAPDASYYLFITENAPNENPVEESYWVEAVERADSLGVDVVNTSLGYYDFDDDDYDYTTSEMDGKTAFITRGANIGFEKGLLLVTSAGNDGFTNPTWRIVAAPADSPGVLTIGAVDSEGNYVAFSSQGSEDQPTQKPDVMAQGLFSAVIRPNNSIGTNDGTSFSSPIMAGAIACFWQAFPNKTNAEIMQLVREYSSLYSTPTFLMGYGIPDFALALETASSPSNTKLLDDIKVYPNPAKHFVIVRLTNNTTNTHLELYNVLGKMVLSKNLNKLTNNVDISTLSNGVYIAKIKAKQSIKTFKLIKS